MFMNNEYDEFDYEYEEYEKKVMNMMMKLWNKQLNTLDVNNRNKRNDLMNWNEKRKNWLL